MCGFSITNERIFNIIRHRGIVETNCKKGSWFFNFNSLPLSSGRSGPEQPAVVSDKYTLCFNGEIFNYKDLDPAANSDLEYLIKKIRGIQHPGELYLEASGWDGFWSIALFDHEDESIYCFTDPLGKKQLYYRIDKELIGVASEIKPLFMHPDGGRNKKVNPFAVGDGGPIPTALTCFEGVNRILPGDFVRIPVNGSPAECIIKRSLNYMRMIQTPGSLYDIIDKSVKDRMENKLDGISVLLSAGWDSNIILHHLLKHTGDIEIVSYVSAESEDVESIARRYGLPIKWVSPEPDQLGSAVWAYESPLDYGSLLPNYLLFKRCSNSIVYTGDGADELFSGYNRAREKDTFYYDVFTELPYYHNVRLDRMAMIHTKEARSPLMSNPLLAYSLQTPWRDRVGKSQLKEIYRDLLPPEVTRNKEKTPLRTNLSKDVNMKTCFFTFNKIYNEPIE